MAEPPQKVRVVIGPDDARGGPIGFGPNHPQGDVGQRRDNQDEQQVRHAQNLLDSEYTRVGRLPAVTDNQAGGSTGRMVRDVVVYTLARLALVAAITAVIFYVAQLIGVQVPLAVAILFAIVIALPLGIWLLAPLRRRATAGISEVDERRRRDREQLEARLRGED